jgi:hypothetical protein
MLTTYMANRTCGVIVIMVDLLENRCSVVNMGHYLMHRSFQRICPNMFSFLIRKCKLCTKPAEWIINSCQLFMTAY